MQPLLEKSAVTSATAPTHHWSTSLREGLAPYAELMRLDKPTGTWLVFWPFAWGLSMAAIRVHLDPWLYIRELCKAFFCAFLTRSFACTINDVCDYEFDKHVERTKSRPLASGRISYLSACLFAGGQAVNATICFFFLLNRPAFIAALIQLIPLSCVYPLLKRITYWPQAWLGLAINYGLFVSWLQVTGIFDLPLLLSMLLAMWSWTMLYDTIYACQDKSDDAKAGVHSTALLFGSYIQPILIFLGLTFTTALAAGGLLNRQGEVFFLVGVGGTALHLSWQFATVDLDSPQSCRVNFKRNGQLGWIVFGGLALDYAIQFWS